MQFWEDNIYPRFLETVEGERFKFMTDKSIKEICYSLATRAISSFKFPRVDLSYSCIYLDASGNEVEKTDNWVVQKWYFINDVTDKELTILVAWMKAFWFGDLNSSADDFVDQYTDINIKVNSKANQIDKNWKKYTDALAIARRLEHDYSRVNLDGTPALGNISDD